MIKIDANIKGYQNKLKKIEDETKNLEDQLKKVGKTSAVIFAGLTATIGATVMAYKNHEQATMDLEAALASQGMLNKETIKDYRDLASEMQTKMALDDDEVVKIQAKMQGFLGQTKMTKELMFATADLAKAQGMDLKAAALLVGKTIGSSTNALGRYGVEIDASASKTEKMEAVIKAVNSKWKGFALAGGEGLNTLTVLKMTIGDVMEQIGKHFAPAIIVVSRKLISFFEILQKHPTLLKFAAGALAIGAATSGVVTVVIGATLAFVKLRAAIMASTIAMNVAKLGVRALIGATGIGLVLVAVGAVYEYWDYVWPAMTATFKSFVDNISSMGSGFGKIMKGIFTLDTDLIKEGTNQIKKSFSQSFEDTKKHYQEKRAEMKMEAEAEAEIQKQSTESMLEEEQSRWARLMELNNQQKEVKKSEAND